MDSQHLYAALQLPPSASQLEVKQAFKTLVTKSHPDKGGSPEVFQNIQKAYSVLSDSRKKKVYDETGTILMGAEEKFAESFAQGAFSEIKSRQHARQDVAKQLALQPTPATLNHSAGFDAWLRSRGEGFVDVITAEKLAAEIGVEKSTYSPILLPPGSVAAVSCSGSGEPNQVLAVGTTSISSTLEWGEIWVKLLMSPINPSDLYTTRSGGRYGSSSVTVPFTPGHDGVAEVLQIGPGVAAVNCGDWVIPARAQLGCWQNMAVWREKDVIKVKSPQDNLPVELSALARQACAAYVMLESSKLKPGDAIILNAANSLAGQLLIQLSHILHLRAVAVIRHHTDAAFQKASEHLKKLGAYLVLPDTPRLQEELAAQLKFSAKPKLGLDAVGGDSAIRLASTLAEGADLIVYGCMSGRPAVWPWQTWVFGELKVRGFNAFKWMSRNQDKVVRVLQQLKELMDASLVNIDYTEYDLATEFPDALEHAMAGGKCTKVVLVSCSDAAGSCSTSMAYSPRSAADL